MPSKEAYDQAVSKAHATLHDEEAIRLAELAASAEMGLGRALDEPTLIKLAAIQADLRAAHMGLVLRLEAGALTPEDCLNQINMALALSMERSLACSETKGSMIYSARQATIPEVCGIDRSLMGAIVGRLNSYRRQQ
jgi:hypothetical protein